MKKTKKLIKQNAKENNNLSVLNENLHKVIGKPNFLQKFYNKIALEITIEIQSFSFGGVYFCKKRQLEHYMYDFRVKKFSLFRLF